MHTELTAFLDSHEALTTESASWSGGQILLSVTSYVTDDGPPDELVTSARCVITAGECVLVMTNPGGDHILPGGRRESGERVTETLIREVHEETGLVISGASQLAVLHFHHETPKPAIYPYPYPDFLNLVYSVHLDRIPKVIVADTYELQGEFVPIALLSADRIPEIQWGLLQRLSNNVAV